MFVTERDRAEEENYEDKRETKREIRD